MLERGIPGSIDGCLFSRLGIETYGFLPMNLSADFLFWQYMHAADERIPVESNPRYQLNLNEAQPKKLGFLLSFCR